MFDFQGALADYVVVKDWQLARKPENISFEEAASLPHVGKVLRLFRHRKLWENFINLRMD